MHIFYPLKTSLDILWEQLYINDNLTAVMSLLNTDQNNKNPFSPNENRFKNESNSIVFKQRTRLFAP